MDGILTFVFVLPLLIIILLVGYIGFTGLVEEMTEEWFSIIIISIFATVCVSTQLALCSDERFWTDVGLAMIRCIKCAIVAYIGYRIYKYFKR